LGLFVLSLLDRLVAKVRANSIIPNSARTIWRGPVTTTMLVVRTRTLLLLLTDFITLSCCCTHRWLLALLALLALAALPWAAGIELLHRAGELA
jgi:hypothetical protein